jgi:3-hydroxybutyrate dehydrogenase
MSQRRILVTGAASGIGRELAGHFARQGAHVIAADLDASGVASLCESLPHAVQGLTLDLADSHSIEAAAAVAGTIDVLVNNAGLQHVARLEDFPPEAWRRLVDVMLVGPAMLSRQVLPGMQARNFGRIINVGSIHSLVASPFKSAYVAAKHGLVGLTRALALETAGWEITANAVCPGYVLTPLVDSQIDSLAREHRISRERVIEDIVLKPCPKKRFVTAAEIAACCDYLVSDAARNITGQCIVIDGGWTAQ